MFSVIFYPQDCPPNLVFIFCSLYRIIVVMIDQSILKKELDDIFEGEILLTYKDWIKKENKIGIPYIAFAFEGEKYNSSNKVIIGNGDTFDNTLARRKRRTINGQQENGNLIPGKQYAIAVRGYTEKVILLFYNLKRTITIILATKLTKCSSEVNWGRVG